MNCNLVSLSVFVLLSFLTENLTLTTAAVSFHLFLDRTSDVKNHIAKYNQAHNHKNECININSVALGDKTVTFANH